MRILYHIAGTLYIIGIITFIGWMGGYNFGRNRDGALWAFMMAMCTTIFNVVMITYPRDKP